MYFKENKFFLDIYVSENFYMKVPKEIINKEDDCIFVLGNYLEVEILEDFLGYKGILDCFCFDYIRLYKIEGESDRLDAYKSYENYKISLMDNIHNNHGDIEVMDSKDKQRFLKILKSILP